MCFDRAGRDLKSTCHLVVRGRSYAVVSVQGHLRSVRMNAASVEPEMTPLKSHHELSNLRLFGRLPTLSVPISLPATRRAVELKPAIIFRLSGSDEHERQSPTSSYQRGSRNPRPPNPLAFWRRYSAKVASACFSSETDFCSRAVLMAAQNEASIWVSSSRKVARNTPRR